MVQVGMDSEGLKDYPTGYLETTLSVSLVLSGTVATGFDESPNGLRRLQISRLLKLNGVQFFRAC